MMRAFDVMIASFFDKMPHIRAADLVIPVPVHWNRRHGRGYNQALLIACSVAGSASIPVYRGGLIKIRNTPPQTGISKKRRIRNLHDSFLAPDRLSLAGKSVLLVDDVITTGATMETCAAELLRAGAREVLGFTIAKTPLLRERA
jgi:ComF family protein